MKKTIFSALFMAGVITLTLTLSSNANGPGGNRTGSPGSSGNCGSCHGGGNFNGSINAGIVEIGDTTFISTYTPNKVYEVYVNSKGTSTKKGFQTTIIKSDLSEVGTLASAPSGTSTYMSGTKKIWGHTTPSTTGNWRMQWTAPAAGAGDVFVYGASVLANANGNDNGDQVVTGTKTIKEAVASNQKNIQKSTIKLLGNPVQNQVLMSESVLYMAIWNNSGQIVAKSSNSDHCEIGNLAAGTYFLQVLPQNHISQSFVIEVR
jgi:hypothetical protein